MCIKSPGVISRNRIINPYNRQIPSESKFSLCAHVPLPINICFTFFQQSKPTRDEKQPPQVTALRAPPHHGSLRGVRGARRLQRAASALNPKRVLADAVSRAAPPRTSTQRAQACREVTAPTRSEGRPLVRGGCRAQGIPTPPGFAAGTWGTLTQLRIKPRWSSVSRVSKLTNHHEVGETGL